MLAALLLLVACDDGSCDTGAEDCDTGTFTPTTTPLPFYDGPTFIGIDPSQPSVPNAESAIGYGCDEDAFWYEFWTVGWTSGGDLAIVETGVDDPWQEIAHVVPSIGGDPDGYWDHLYLVLPVVPRSQQRLNTALEPGNTAFTCPHGQPAQQLTWMLTVYDPRGEPADCAVWGADPSALGDKGCTVWE